MGFINSEKSNARRLREHQHKKLLRAPTTVTHEETDLMMCSSVINLGNSVNSVISLLSLWHKLTFQV